MCRERRGLRQERTQRERGSGGKGVGALLLPADDGGRSVRHTGSLRKVKGLGRRRGRESGSRRSPPPGRGGGPGPNK